MYFGKYLIENNIIDKKILIKCISKQMTSPPSVIDIILELEIFTIDNLFEIMIESIKQNENLIDTIFNKYPKEKLEILKYQELKSSSLLDVLLKDKILSVEELKKHLEIFNSHEDNDSSENIDKELDEILNEEESMSEEKVIEDMDKELDETLNEEELMSEEEVTEDTDKELDEVLNEEELISKEEIIEDTDEKLDEILNEEELVSKEEVSEDVDKKLDEVLNEEELISKEEVSEDTNKKSEEILNKEELISKEEITEEIDALDDKSKELSNTPTEKDDNKVNLSGSIENFLNIYSDKINDEIHNIVEIISSDSKSSKEIVESLNELYLKLKIIEGSFILIEESYAKNLIEIWISIIEKFLKIEGDKLKLILQDHSDVTKKSLDLIWYVRNLISTNGGKDNIMSSGDLKNEYRLLLKELKKLIDIAKSQM